MRYKRYSRRSANQNAFLREYSRIGYTQRGLDYEGNMVVSKRHDAAKKLTVIVVDRKGNQTNVRIIGAHEEPMLCGERA